MLVPIPCGKPPWRSFGRLSGSQPSAWIWAWSRDSPRFMRRHPPHHLGPARANRPAGQDPEAASAAPGQHSNARIKPKSQSILSQIIAHLPNPDARIVGESMRLGLLGRRQAVRQPLFDFTIRRFESSRPSRSLVFGEFSFRDEKSPPNAGFSHRLQSPETNARTFWAENSRKSPAAIANTPLFWRLALETK
jgi:hypothetical protein